MDWNVGLCWGTSEIGEAGGSGWCGAEGNARKCLLQKEPSRFVQNVLKTNDRVGHGDWGFSRLEPPSLGHLPDSPLARPSLWPPNSGRTFKDCVVDLRYCFHSNHSVRSQVGCTSGSHIQRIIG